ncbi:MAG: hypothetical protein HQK77_16125 [Desulfobacterales bacterium]|nr:hypothetical protein [Desulfobacterales bacterium]
MKKEKPIYFQDADKCAAYVVEQIGKDIRLGMCLGLGKPNYFANAIYKKAKENPEINLKIFTALSLEKPTWSTELERRFMEPLVERVWKDYVDLEYILAVRNKKIPSNVEVYEFFYKAGGFLDNPHMQQNYISTNYTHAARDVVDNGVNLLGQLICKSDINKRTYYSLSCNSDTSLDALRLMRERDVSSGKKSLAVGEINSNLPFMYGDAVVEPEVFDVVIDNPAYSASLFGAPREPVLTIDYMIGMYTSSLIKDGGTLQIGIGSLGDAICYGLQMRHQQNTLYKEFIRDSNALAKFGTTIDKVGGIDIFDKGIYGSTEMLVDGFIHLYKSGIMKRKVYDDVPIMRLLTSGKIKETLTPNTLDILIDYGVIQSVLTQEDFNYLIRFGFFKEQVKFENNTIVVDSHRFSSDFNDKQNREQVSKYCLGNRLRNGFWMHAGFFLGPQDFYDTLNQMTEEERHEINMTSVLNVNQLYAHQGYSSQELKILQRKDFRSINAGLMVTLNGAVVSDGLENGLVISGVGGQFNFVAMSHELPGGRGGIMIRSTRAKGKEVNSNVVYNYGHITVPRHLRDIIITEYGIADLRGREDKHIIASLINVADSRFQDQLLQKAKSMGKLPQSYEIPDMFRNNYPEQLDKIVKSYKEKGLFPAFPFGTAFTKEEIVLGKSLRLFKQKASESKLSILPGLISQTISAVPETAKPYLERMKLDKPTTTQEKMMQKIVVYSLILSNQI